jgi:dipeptidyl aminopeptidase/acylaminoacyl peptidase
MLDLAQLLRVPNIDNGLRFDLSPDGGKVAFSWNASGNWEIYEMPLSPIGMGLTAAELLSGKISGGPGSKFSPRYSPDGSMLAYALDLDGSESYHIVVHDLKNRSGKDLTPDTAYAHQPNIAWSPDGKTLAVLSDVKGQFALFLLPIESSPATLLWNIFHPSWDVAWSPDGQWIALESESIASDRSIHLVPVNRPRKGKKPGTIQLKINGNILNAQHPTWSPDSKFLAFSAELGEWHDIGLFNVETQEITWVNQSVGDDTQPAWSQSGEAIGWIHAEGARTSFRFNKGGGEVKDLEVGSGVHYLPRFTSDGVVILYEDPGRPSDLWKINLDDGLIQQLTNSLPAELSNADFVHPEEIFYEGNDGTQVPALLYRAINAGKDSPAVINIHGGPNWHFQFLWHPMMSYMASRGWIVLVPNYRGSTGYGKKWQSASRFDMGGVDTNDCAAGATYLTQHELADKNKIAVTGRSHGGYLTMTCMTMFPDLWAGGSAIVPFLNWIDSHYKSREDLQHWNIENMGDPEENRELWIERSPYFFLDKIKAPVQMICGENDPRCPASESISARDKLVKLGREVELILFKGEGHSFLDTKNVIDSEVRRMEFLTRVLE